MPTKPTAAALKTLRLRLAAQQEELATCDTAAKVRCVKQAIADTERQLTELGQ
jgi:hypothetical protein